jgi:hypothetical protein
LRLCALGSALHVRLLIDIVRDEGDGKDYLVRPERFELPTYCSGGNRSIHLSYGRTPRSVYMGQGKHSNAEAEKLPQSKAAENLSAASAGSSPRTLR